MANAPQVKLFYRGGCPDCAIREVQLPPPLPKAGDDFDWLARDYDAIRMFMLEELAARFPERRRWTPADLEVVLVEVLSTILDQLSDMTDRVAAEAYLETARKPETIRELLKFIGYDALAKAKQQGQIKADQTEQDNLSELENYWRTHPQAMEQARRAGPWEIHTQKRMVTVEDYALRIREHPLVMLAHAWKEWSGSWYTIRLAVILQDNYELDENISYSSDSQQQIDSFHVGLGLPAPDFDSAPPPSVRMILRSYLDAFRMAGQEVILQDPLYVGIYLSISVKVNPSFFQSEIRHAITDVLGHGPNGFFEPGRLGFGEDLYASDVIEALMKLDGIVHVCLNRFKRIGSQYPDRAENGFIPLHGLEVALCNNNTGNAAEGYYRLKLHGGQKG